MATSRGVSLRSLRRCAGTPGCRGIFRVRCCKNCTAVHARRLSDDSDPRESNADRAAQQRKPLHRSHMRLTAHHASPGNPRASIRRLEGVCVLAFPSPSRGAPLASVARTPSDGLDFSDAVSLTAPATWHDLAPCSSHTRRGFSRGTFLGLRPGHASATPPFFACLLACRSRDASHATSLIARPIALGCTPFSSLGQPELGSRGGE